MYFLEITWIHQNKTYLLGNTGPGCRFCLGHNKMNLHDKRYSHDKMYLHNDKTYLQNDNMAGADPGGAPEAQAPPDPRF